MGRAVTLAPLGHPTKIVGDLNALFPKFQRPSWRGGTTPPSASPPWEPRGAELEGSSLLSPFLVAVLGGTAGWGAWAGISGNRDSLEGAVVPRAGFRRQIIHLDSALEIATESLPLISKTAQRYLFPIPTHLISLLTHR